MDDATGLTKDAGWELGVRQTVPAPLAAVWDYLLGEGLPVWLGEIDSLPVEKGAAYQTRDGVHGTIRSFTDGLRVRLTWQPEDWPHDSTLQVTVKEASIPARTAAPSLRDAPEPAVVGPGTTIGFHHDRLADRDERKLMLGHWKNVAASLAAHFGG